MRRLALWTLAAALLAAVCFVLPSAIQAQGIDGIPACEYPDAEYYQAGVFPRYEAPGQRVVLVSFYTGEDVLVLDTGVEVERFYGLGWSEDCRYVAVSLGTDASLDTVVYDVAEARRVGVVPDAHRQPHAITWGPEAYLVVETRNGGILWDVAANTQTLLTTAWNTTTVRNFSRLRWDADNGQLIANLAVGGRVVYDLATGRELAVAANVTFDPHPPSDGVVYGRIVVGGRSYPCQSDYTYGYWQRIVRETVIPGVYVEYDVSNRAIYLSLEGEHFESEAIQMVEDNVTASTYHFRGWAPGCRYFAASLGIPGQDATDTVVWDVVESRRFGAFEDARLIEHPIYWSPTGDALVVVTREGTFLWVLPTNTPYLLTSAVETALAGTSGLRGFSDLEWNAETGLLYIVPVNETDRAYAYRITTGQRVDVLTAEGGQVPAAVLPAAAPPITPVDATAQTPLPTTSLAGVSGWSVVRPWQYRAVTDLCGGARVAYDAEARQLALTMAETGEPLRVLEGDLNATSYLFWSPDCRFIAGHVSQMSNTDVPYDDAPLDDIYRDRVSHSLVIWDAATGQRLQVLPNASLSWSPAGERAFVRAMTGFFLWEAASNQLTPLTFKDANQYRYGSGFADVIGGYWDYARGQIYVSGWRAIYAFDIQTGAERYQYIPGGWGYSNSGCNIWGCYFEMSEDDRVMFVRGYSALGIWDLDTLEYTSLDIQTHFGQSFALSADNRHLVIAYKIMRVYDVQADGLLIAQHGGPRYSVQAMHFVDDNTIETTDYYGTVQRWNILTGEEVPVG